jgi:hypothetical protein
MMLLVATSVGGRRKKGEYLVVQWWDRIEVILSKYQYPKKEEREDPRVRGKTGRHELSSRGPSRRNPPGYFPTQRVLHQ